ncbi:MAG: hypothetical protein KA586_09495 [Candidatus Promineofilum sp.]|nr:hypothetical protein [Promineifilum sp.]
MPRHIYDQYAPGDRVEIVFSNRGEDEWQPAVVVGAEPPGIWVRAAGGQEWFMTNTYRIRPADPSDPEKRSDA